MSKCVSSECPGKIKLLLTLFQSNGVSFPPAWPEGSSALHQVAGILAGGHWLMDSLPLSPSSFTQSNFLSLGACETTLGSQNQRTGETTGSLQPPGPLTLSSSWLPAPMPHDFLQQLRGCW